MLPIYLPDLDDREERKLHDSLCKAARDLTQMNATLGKTHGHEQVATLRRIGRSWKVLNSSVAILYGLSADEIELFDRSWRRPDARQVQDDD